MSVNFVQQQLNIFFGDAVEGFRFSDFREIFNNFLYIKALHWLLMLFIFVLTVFQTKSVTN